MSAGGLASAKSVPLLCRGHSRPVVDLSFSHESSDGFFLASACLDGKPMIRVGSTGDWIGTFNGHKGAVWSARFNSNATQVATSSADYTVKIWNALTGDELQTFSHGKIVKTANFSHDDKLLVTGGLEKIIRVFDVEKPESPFVTLGGGSSTLISQSIRLTRWVSSDNLILSAGAETNIRVWDIRAGEQIRMIELGEGENISSVEHSQDGSLLTCCSASHVYFLDSTSLEVKKHVPLAKNTNANCASIHPNHDFFVVGSNDFWIRVFDFKTCEELEIHRGHHGPVHSVQYSPDGELFASGSEDGTIRLWQTTPKKYGLWDLAENVQTSS